jgi:hypothetical protein
VGGYPQIGGPGDRTGGATSLSPSKLRTPGGGDGISPRPYMGRAHAAGPGRHVVIECKRCGQRCGSPAGLASHTRAKHPDGASYATPETAEGEGDGETDQNRDAETRRELVFAAARSGDRVRVYRATRDRLAFLLDDASPSAAPKVAAQLAVVMEELHKLDAGQQKDPVDELADARRSRQASQ